MAIESSTSQLALIEGDQLLNRNADPDEDLPDEPLSSAKHEDQTDKEFLLAQLDVDNLAEDMDDQDLDQLGMLCVREFQMDDLSRSEWLDEAQEAIRFAEQKTRPKSTPWPGASSMIYPLVTKGALDFNARTYPAMIQGRKVVKGVVWGDDDGVPTTVDGKEGGQPIMGAQGPVWLIPPGERRRIGDRVAEHMSYQLLVEMPEWEPQTDQMLLQMPVVGGAVRKTYYCTADRRNKSLFVSLLNIVWSYTAPSFEAAPRISEKVLLYPTDIIEKERAGYFLKQTYGVGGGTDGETFDGKPIGQSDNEDDDAPHLFIEQHRRIDMDGDGYAEPYIVTVHLRSSKVVRIVARYEEDGIEAESDGTIIRVRPVDYYTLYRFLPNVSGGSYPMGLGHILKALGEGINTALNQMFDAGTLANSMGGFVSDQLAAPSGQTLFQTGKFHRVNTKGGNIRDAVYPLQFPGPSPVLFQLLGLIIDVGKDLAGVGDILAGDAAIANAPPTTIVSLIEQGLTFYTAVVKRVFNAEKAELNKLYRLNRLHITKETKYISGGVSRMITPEDYRFGGGVEPVADPSMTTDMQKLGRAQLIMSTAGDPIINKQEAYRRLFAAAQIDRIDDLFAPPPDPQAAQMQMAMAQAELGKVRAAELKDQTQAFLNMALARKNASAGEEAQLDAQLEFMRLRIEAINSAIHSSEAAIKAAHVDHKFHQTNVDQQQADAQRAHDLAMATAQSPPAAPTAQPTPAPAGPFPEATAPPAPGPDITSASAPGTGTPPSDLAGAGPSGPPAQALPNIAAE